MSELPSGTVTFLFTDLEGSTRLWEEHPEAMRPALARLDELRARGGAMGLADVVAPARAELDLAIDGTEVP